MGGSNTNNHTVSMQNMPIIRRSARVKNHAPRIDIPRLENTQDGLLSYLNTGCGRCLQDAREAAAIGLPCQARHRPATLQRISRTLPTRSRYDQPPAASSLPYGQQRLSAHAPAIAAIGPTCISHPFIYGRCGGASTAHYSFFTLHRRCVVRRCRIIGSIDLG